MSLACQCHQIAYWTIAMTTHRTESQLQDHRGYGMGKYPTMSSFWWLAIIYLDSEYSHSIEECPCHQVKGGFIPWLYQARGNINTSNSTKPDKNLCQSLYQMRPRHEGMPKQDRGGCKDTLIYGFQWTVVEILIFMAFYSSSSLHVNTISIITLFYVAHGSEHGWLFNVLKLFLLQKVSMLIMNGWDNNENYMSFRKVWVFCSVIVLKCSHCHHLGR